MARALRIQMSGLTYHVRSRGNGRMAIYLDDGDRDHFLALFAEVTDLFRLVCPAYCLMANHYHLVVMTPDANLSGACQALNGRYARWWNDRHNRIGHAFHGRFGAKIVQQDDYLITVCKYVVLNPVRQGLVASPEQWPWSSCRATAGLEPVPPFLQPQMLWEVLGGRDVAESMARYRRFVATPSDDSEKMGRPIIGDPEYAERFEEFRKRASREVPRRERQTMPLEAVFRGAVTRAERNAGALRARLDGHSIVEIARYLGLHPSTVSKMIAGVAGGQT